MSELEKRLMKHIDLLVERYPSLESEKNSIISAYLLLEECYVMVENCLWQVMEVRRQMQSILSVN